ncbi:hypothetical protein [Variovorax rhizosphaerae]|uniref:Uncharacterized protein n=1 Tax=Variovorax rhizosphaerae TaxID=1836200 RepID=A0ABU8WE89_9BURK
MATEGAPPPASRQPEPVPAGCRQGIVTAVTIFIGFSLAFLRFWTFEAPGDWTPRSVLAAVILGVPIAMEIHVLFRLAG